MGDKAAGLVVRHSRKPNGDYVWDKILLILLFDAPRDQQSRS